MKKSKQFGSKPQHKQAGFAPQSKANQTEEDIYVFSMNFFHSKSLLFL